MKNRAFTLIELLVVVLIIGILAAIALPQYQKAVEKSRTAEAQLILSSVSRAVDEYLLANGFPKENVELMGSTTATDGAVGILSVSVEDNLDCVSSSGYCVSKHFMYDSFCSTSACTVRAKRYLKSDFSDMNSHYYLRYRYLNNKWQHECLV